MKRTSRSPTRRQTVHPALRQIHDLLYLDPTGGRPFYNPDKQWDAETLDAIAGIVARHIPIPGPVSGARPECSVLPFGSMSLSDSAAHRTR
jgi:hypothetical protein